MILGLFLIDTPIGFVSFENFTRQVDRHINSKTELYEFLDSTEYKNGEYATDNLKIDIFDLKQDLQMGIVYLLGKEIDPMLYELIKETGLRIAQGEKEIIHRILLSQDLSDVFVI